VHGFGFLLGSLRTLSVAEIKRRKLFHSTVMKESRLDRSVNLPIPIDLSRHRHGFGASTFSKFLAEGGKSDSPPLFRSLLDQ
jgi:hypothetical protein